MLKGYVVLDVETTILSYMKRKASPFHKDNWIVAAAYRNVEGEVCGSYFGSNKTASYGWFSRVLAENPRFVVGFNVKFDILHLIQNTEDYANYMAWIARGGELWDAQLAEYLLDGMVQESQMLSLDEVAVRYGGELKIDEVKAFWERGINTDEIPKGLLMDYLAGRTADDGTVKPGDIQNTDIIFRGQMAAAKKAKQVQSIRLNNGALVATVEMEHNGLFVNMEKGRKQATYLAGQVKELSAKLGDYLPKDLPFEYNWRSRKQLSAFIFGGRVPYKQRVHQVDEAGLPAYAKAKVVGYELDDGRFIEYGPVGSSHPESYVYYKSGKKKGQPKTKQIDVNDYTKPKLKWEEFHYTFKGLTKPKPHWQGADPGVYSTSSDVIEELGETTDIPFLLDFANLQTIIKDLGTYYIQEEFNEEGELVKAKGMLTLVQPDGIVHHKLNMTSTVTARLSHSDPNAGNLPRGDDGSAKGKHTSLVKEMFESRWQAEGAIISSDFKSLEVYCQAILSGDKQLIADLQAGLDMHVARLSTVEGKPYDEVLLLAKGDKRKGIDKDPVWDEKRTHIKVFSFQRAYGAGATKIGASLKVAVDLVEKWIEADNARYPEVPKFNERVEQMVTSSKQPTERWRVHPTTKQNLRMFRGQLRTFDGKKYVFQESPSPDFMVKKGVLQSFSPTEMKNYPVQGLGGEWMKAAMWLAVRIFYTYKNFGGLAALINTVHDALYADSHKTVRRKVGVVVHASMLAASDLIEYLFNKEIEVPVPSETTYGSSMAEAAEFDDPDAFEASAEKVRVWLRATYMDGFTPSFIKE